MKVGMICECAPGGPDLKVGEFLVKRSAPDAEFIGASMLNKDNLIRDCGRQVRFFFERDKCDVVFVLWDLAPAWPDRKEKRCRRRDKEGIAESLRAAYGAAKPPASRIILVCIEQMLESWLVADGNAVFEHLSRPSHKAPRFPSVRRPDSDRDPKARLMNYFEQARRNYNEHVDALPIIQRARPSELRRSDSFRRFEEKLQNLTDQ